MARWPALLERNIPGQAASQAPVLLAQGSADERVAPASNRSMAQRLCRAGDRVELRTYANAAHLGIIDAAGGDVLAWLGDRPASRPPDPPANARADGSMLTHTPTGQGDARSRRGPGAP